MIRGFSKTPARSTARTLASAPTLRYPRGPSMSARTKFGIGFAYACAAVVASVYILRGAFVPRLVDALKYGRGDCVINWLGARAWISHVDPYSATGLKWAGLSVMGHPPTTPMWYLPFWRYDIFELSQIFGHLLVFMLLVHLVLVASELRLPQPLATALFGFALVMDTSWWVYHVQMVQLSEPIALFYVLAWICLRRHHDVASGILLGLACTMKLYAGLVLLLLVLGRRWRGVIAAAIVYLGFAALATWRFGFACWYEYLPMLRSTQNAWLSNLKNASLHGVILRLWWRPGGPRGPALTSATLLSWGLALAIIAAMAWLSRRALAKKPATVPGTIDESIDLPFALVSTASVWLNPVVWEHYDVTLLFPMAVAVVAAWRVEGRRRVAWVAATVVVIAFVVYLLSIDMYAKNQAHDRRALVWYVTANWLPWPLVMGVLGVLLWRQDRLSAGAGARPA
jgi:hypothetical protein